MLRPGKPPIHKGTPQMTWKKCPSPGIGDILRWTEPLWAAPTKKRGRPDQIGTQQVIAEVTAIDDVVTLTVHEVEILSADAEGATTKIKPGDSIRRKKDSLQRGDCHRRG